MAQGGAYFIGKAELLGWINSTLALNLSKIEQARWAAASKQRSLAVHGAMYIP
jgi:RP/EB family microtubule-associated protein